jgi:hypothetical protein
MKLIGTKWQALSDEEKKPFVDLAIQDKIRHKNEVFFFSNNFFLLKKNTESIL